MIHVTSLADDYYYLEAGTHTLVGRRSGRRHRLGDRIVVRVAHVDVDRRQLDLVLADTPLALARNRPGAPSSSSGSSSGRDEPARPSRPRAQAGDDAPSTGHRRPSPTKAKKGKVKAKSKGKTGRKKRKKSS